MRHILAVPLMFLYVAVVMVTSGHLHYDLKAHPACILCELSKAVAVAESMAAVTPVAHSLTIPVPDTAPLVTVSTLNVIVHYGSARAPPRCGNTELTDNFKV